MSLFFRYLDKYFKILYYKNEYINIIKKFDPFK